MSGWKIAQVRSKIKDDAFADERQFVSFVLGVMNSLRNQAAKSEEMFAESILLSGFIPILNRLSDTLRSRLTPIFARYRNAAALRELGELKRAVKNDRFYFLNNDSPGGASSQFYSLPLRVSKILGWLGLLLYESKYLGLGDEVKSEVSSLLSDIVDDYPKAFSAVSESQAAHVFLGVKGLLDVGCGAQACYIYLNYLESIGKNRGEVCSLEASGEEILTYISLYGSSAIKAIPRIVASPTQFFFVILLLARHFGLESELDRMMHVFDRKYIYAYITNNHQEFGDERMRDGVNLPLQVGFSFWTMDEFYEFVSNMIDPRIRDDEGLISPDVQYISIVSSLVFEDRVPLFL